MSAAKHHVILHPPFLENLITRHLGLEAGLKIKLNLLSGVGKEGTQPFVRGG